MSEETLFKHGLIRVEKRAWTMKTAEELGRVEVWPCRSVENVDDLEMGFADA